MKTYTDDALDALENGTAIISGAVEILTDDPVRIFGGLGVIEIDGETYTGVGDNGQAIESGATIGGIAQNLVLQLSGIDPVNVTVAETDGIKGAPIKLYSLICDGSGTVLLDAQVHQRGRIDFITVEEKSGGESSIAVTVESPGRGLGRRTGRMRSDADQRLVDPTDGGMSRISYAGEKVLYWGGKKPATAGGALGGSRVNVTGRFNVVNA